MNGRSSSRQFSNVLRMFSFDRTCACPPAWGGSVAIHTVLRSEKPLKAAARRSGAVRLAGLTGQLRSSLLQSVDIIASKERKAIGPTRSNPGAPLPLKHSRLRSAKELATPPLSKVVAAARIRAIPLTELTLGGAVNIRTSSGARSAPSCAIPRLSTTSHAGCDFSMLSRHVAAETTAQTAICKQVDTSAAGANQG
jgi:hypothetical protein